MAGAAGRYEELRRAAEVHRTVRHWAKRELLRPGMKMIDICEALEDRVRPPAPLAAGLLFRVGVGACLPLVGGIARRALISVE